MKSHKQPNFIKGHPPIGKNEGGQNHKEPTKSHKELTKSHKEPMKSYKEHTKSHKEPIKSYKEHTKSHKELTNSHKQPNLIKGHPPIGGNEGGRNHKAPFTFLALYLLTSNKKLKTQ